MEVKINIDNLYSFGGIAVGGIIIGGVFGYLFKDRTKYPSNVDHITKYPSNVDHITKYPSNVDHITLVSVYDEMKKHLTLPFGTKFIPVDKLISCHLNGTHNRVVDCITTNTNNATISTSFGDTKERSSFLQEFAEKKQLLRKMQDLKEKSIYKN